MNYWLMKSEPDVFGIEHLKACPDKTDGWDGVRNYQARNMMRDQMKKGDLVFFYHSNCKVPGIVGIMKIAKESYVDDTAFDPKQKYYDPKSSPENPRWFRVDVTYQKTFKRTIPLSELRENPLLENMALLRKGNRLSIMPVSADEWQAILDMA
jgi:predicted RNA-binding protein with PUA-like domain